MAAARFGMSASSAIRWSALEREPDPDPDRLEFIDETRASRKMARNRSTLCRYAADGRIIFRDRLCAAGPPD